MHQMWNVYLPNGRRNWLMRRMQELHASQVKHQFHYMKILFYLFERAHPIYLWRMRHVRCTFSSRITRTVSGHSICVLSLLQRIVSYRVTGDDAIRIQYNNIVHESRTRICTKCMQCVWICVQNIKHTQQFQTMNIESAVNLFVHYYYY